MRKIAYPPSLTFALVLLLGLSPTLLLTTSGAGSAVYYLLLLAGLVHAGRRAPPFEVSGFWQTYRWVALAFALPLLAALVSGLQHGQLHGSDVEKALRFAFLLPLLWLFLALPPARLKWAAGGFGLGALVACAVLAVLAYVSPDRPDTPQFNAVAFGNLTLLFGVLAGLLLAIPGTAWQRAARPVRVFLALALLAGLCGLALSQTRSGWLAVPVFALLILVALGRPSRRTLLMLVAGPLVAAALVLAASDGLRERVQVMGDEVVQLVQDGHDQQFDTSLGIRVQLLGAAWRMMEADPGAGAGGSRGFRQSLKAMGERGEVSALVARNFGEPHNDLAFFGAAYGVPGLLALLAIYLVPIGCFACRLRQPDRAARVFAALGLVFCVGFLLYGTFDMMFRGMRTVSFYALWVAALLALSHPRQATRPVAEGGVM